jgi:glycosyltransferase involved in cell wall biosynthesis
MRILSVSNLYPPNEIGGYEVLCAEVSEGLAARGHKVTILASCFGGRPADGRPVVVHQALQLVVGRTIYEPFAGSPVRREAVNRANVAAFLRCLDRVQPDVVFCWNLHGLDASLLERLCAEAVPVVIMLTDSWLAGTLNPAFVTEYFRRGVYAPPGIAYVPVAGVAGRTLRASAVFGSVFMRDFYAAAGIRFRSDQIIPNGVQFSLAPAAMLRDRTRIGEAGTVALLFAGRVVEIKGVHVALEALARLQAERPARLDFTLTVVGHARDAEYMTRLQEIASRSGCADRVRFLDPVPQEQLFQLFQDHDVYLFPSLYEPFSLILIHALAAGIPTVASRVGGNVEIVADGDTGLMSERNDPASLSAAVARLCTDAPLRQRLAQGGAAKAKRFTLDRMLRAMEDYLAAVAA